MRLASAPWDPERRRRRWRGRARTGTRGGVRLSVQGRQLVEQVLNGDVGAHRACTIAEVDARPVDGDVVPLLVGDGELVGHREVKKLLSPIAPGEGEIGRVLIRIEEHGPGERAVEAAQVVLEESARLGWTA